VKLYHSGGLAPTFELIYDMIFIEWKGGSMDNFLLLLGMFIVFLLITLSIDLKVSRVDARLSKMQKQLDQLMKASGIPEPVVNEQLRDLIRQGKKIEAVKLARQSFGYSLVEGKHYIDVLEENEGQG